ncbi:MAG: acylneuraminate cytidylyltransferase family protein [Oligoflexia bacterium]|nr:acylneuraminate cytidylyltransferase family protein [Oligoflexia bacterium]
MNLLAIIPARGGSKGVPRKNIRDMNGKPLLHYTTEVALKTKDLFKRIILSTEDEEIAEVGKQLGVEVPFLRPAEFATDQSKSIDLVKDAVLRLEEIDGITYDAVVLLQPTNPLRIEEDIRKAVELFKKSDTDSVISVARAISNHPAYMKKIDENGYLDHYSIEEVEGTRRQDFKPYAYFRDGAVYITKRDTIVNDNSLWGKRMTPYVIPEERSVGIDSMLDWHLCEIMLKKNQ